MEMRPLNEIHNFLLDLDGTIYLGPHLIPGAAEFVAYLQGNGIPYLFFTNNPSGDAAQYAEKLGQMGIKVTPEAILTAGQATAGYIAQKTSFRRVFPLGTPAFERELENTGLSCTEEDPEVVVLSFDKTLTYAKLERATLLLSAGLPYIATNPDLLCPTEYGYIPDCGSIAALLEAATKRTPKYIGKPNPEMIEMGLARLGGIPENSAMVGDRLYTDMEMAYRTDITSILVLSGETKEKDLEGPVRRPDYCFDSVAELHAALLRAKGNPTETI